MSDGLEEWNSAWRAAKAPRPKSAEILEALDFILENEKSYARATALHRGGLHDADRLRRVAAAEEGAHTLERLAAVFEDLPAKLKKAILGDSRKENDK